jgi:peptidoglycan/LPS O-acetylase OafA/YrhL
MNLLPLPSKPHYPILDGLRGVASFLVVIMHVCEAHSTSSLDMLLNHGYLAVDFFFLLSGFVIGYAYDDRWTKMTVSGFFRRRLIRLQPMVVMGSVIGAIFFYFQDSTIWPAIHTVPIGKMLLVMVIGATLIPVPTSMDIRGWQEMHPLDGPAWSLFFEYIANILYALGIRKFSKKALSVLVFIAAIALVQYAVSSDSGDLIGGWSITGPQLRIGFTRLIFPFFAGLLLSRTIKTTSIPHAFLWCSILLTIFLALPRIGGDTHRWWNGLYEATVIILVFPLIVYMGASGRLSTNLSTRLCKFCGDISYPLYITHYPLIYTYTAWLSDHRNAPPSQFLPRILLTIGGAILLAYGCLKLYDEPVRRWLRKRWASK